MQNTSCIEEKSNNRKLRFFAAKIILPEQSIFFCHKFSTRGFFSESPDGQFYLKIGSAVNGSGTVWSKECGNIQPEGRDKESTGFLTRALRSTFADGRTGQKQFNLFPHSLEI